MTDEPYGLPPARDGRDDGDVAAGYDDAGTAPGDVASYGGGALASDYPWDEPWRPTAGWYDGASGWSEHDASDGGSESFGDDESVTQFIEPYHTPDDESGFGPDLPSPDVTSAEVDSVDDAQPRPARRVPRIVPPEQATARLHIKLPSQPPVPSSTLRPRAAWEGAGDAPPTPTAGAEPPLALVVSPARPTALPSELAAVTTATMVVPVQRTGSPSGAMLTSALPPDTAARGNAADIADAFADTIEQIFGIDFSQDEAPAYSDQGSGSYLLDSASPTDLGDDEFEGFDVVPPPGPPTPLRSPRSEPFYYDGPYGVPTRPAPIDNLPTGDLDGEPANGFISDRRFRGGVFHDSSGETAYFDPSTTGGMPAIRFDEAAPPSRGRFAGAWQPEASVPAPRALPDGEAPGQAPVVEADPVSLARPRQSAPAQHRRPAAAVAEVPPVPTEAPTVGATGKRHGRFALFALAGMVLGLVVLYVVALFTAAGWPSGTVPRGTSVLDVDISGLSRAQAIARLDDGLAAEAQQPVNVVAGETTFQLSPSDAGLAVDAAGTVRAAMATRLDPMVAIPALFGAHRELTPRTSVDQARLRALLLRAASSYDVGLINGEIDFHDGEPHVVAPRTGRVFQLTAAFEAVSSGYLHGASTFYIGAGEQRPLTTLTQLRDAERTMAVPAMSGPLEVVTGAVTSTVSSVTLGDHLTIVPNAAGTLVLRVDGSGLRADLSPRVKALETAPVDARFDVVNGKPVLVPGTVGHGYSPAALASAVAGVVTRTTDRIAVVPIGPLEPSFTTADARALGVREVMAGVSGKVSEEITSAPAAAHNLALAVARLNGTVLAAGAVFGFDDTAGLGATHSGYQPGPVPAPDGQTAQDDASGLSILATDLYQASLRAGLAQLERHPEPYYLRSTQAGLDAAVSANGEDLRFRNDSGHPMYLDIVSHDSVLMVALLGRDAYQSVTVTASTPQAVVKPGNAVSDALSCQPQTGEQGFRIEVTRVLRRSSHMSTRQVFTTSYPPVARVTCGSGAVSQTPYMPGTTGASQPSQSSTSGGGTSSPPSNHPTPPANSPTPPSGFLGGL